MVLPMSPADAFFLLAETPRRPMHVGALAVLSLPEGADARCVREMFAAALARNQVAPLWRRRPRRSASSFGQWYWHTETNVDLQYHLQLGALPPRADETDLWRFASELHTGMLDRSRPLWQMHLIEGLPDGRYAVYIKTHSALADGVSAMRLLQRTFSSDPDQRAMPAPWEVIGQTHGDNVAAQTTAVDPLAAVRTALSAVGDLAGIAPALADAVWRAVRRRGGPLTLAAPHTPLSVPIGSARSFAGRTFSIDRLRMIAKHTDATLNEIVLAMCAGAVRRYLLVHQGLPGAPLMATVPVPLRGDESAGAPDHVPGNKLGGLTCSLATHLADPAERLAAVQASMRDAKAALADRSRMQVLTMSALGVTPLALAMMLGRMPGPLRPPNMVISNVLGPRSPRYWNGARVETIHPMSALFDGQALNITCTSIDDQIAFGLTGCRRAVPRISTLADSLDRELDLLDAFHRISGAHRRDRQRDSRSRQFRAPKR
ncbi:wax ester/triacylglycerol synthase family O-acyltransferase [Mycobacterium sp. SP-6446]|uniref:WS/DGAT/MGAT family O-acyltransferase n=1 Tax=Mycobacterium sp. SP-6446 TaxID=1834162 RepID=UPI00096D5241|nr:wax ester/triacylglycerol synthase family O-acyltransferase [Mycobacterium sp. SP-6446]OMC08421.1 diacylglycerol O-acyltransferase [Mycobacterium sp. SP-6446]